MKIKILLISLVSVALVGCGAQPSASSSKKSESSSEITSSEKTSNSREKSSSSSEESKSSNPSSSVITSYLITFNDYDGSLLESKKWDVGTIPSYNYKINHDNEEWKYTFAGWSLSKGGEVITLPEVSGEATYYAVLNKTKQQYTITFNTNGGSEVSPITKDYGSTVNKPDDPIKDGYVFVSWCDDSSLLNKVEWPLTLTLNRTLYAKWNTKIDIKGYLSSLMSSLKQNPYSYIPETMRPTNKDNFVSKGEVSYNFSSFTNVSTIKYGGFGEQWQMVIDNIQQSQLFYELFSVCDTVINSSVVTFNNWFDNNPSSTNKEINETGYYAKVEFANNVLTYTIQVKTGVTLPVFGEVLPQINMRYDILNKEKAVRVNLTDTNAMRYLISEDSYTFAIKYGIDGVNRSALCSLVKDDETIAGHIYEYINIVGKDLVKSCADFYIDEEYTSVVGNKASGIIGMNNYINELYKTSQGKLIGYKIQETISKTFPVIGEFTATYHTLWFNLNNITGINSVKVLEHTSENENAFNPNDIYVNESNKLFKPAYNSKLTIKTSREFDIELRKQYRFGMVDDVLTTYTTEIPMMFIQDDHDGYTNYSDFVSHIKKENGITASVNLSAQYLAKIRLDYEELIPLFITNKDLIDSEYIQNWIGNPVK